MSTKVLASPLATTATGTMTRARIRVLPGTASPYERFVFHIANVFEELGTDGATLVKLLKFCEPVGAALAKGALPLRKALRALEKMAAKLKKSLARALNNARSAVSDTRHALKAIFRRKYTLNESTSNTITAGRDSARHVEEELVPAARTIAAFVERMAADDKMSTGGKLVERIKALFTIVESELPHAVNLDGPAVSVARIPETESIVSVERESTALASFPNAEQHSKSIEPNRLPVLPPFAPASLPPLPPGRNPAFPEPDYSGITSASSAQIKACAMAQSVHFVVRNALIENGTMVKVARSETVKKAKRAGMKSDHVAQSAFVFTTPIQLGKTSERGDASCNTDDTVMDASGKTVTVLYHRESLDSGLGVDVTEA